MQPDRDDKGRPSGRAALSNNLLDGGYGSESTVPPTLGAAACRIVARRAEHWPTLDAWLTAWNRRTELARAASHVVCVALDTECTSSDVQAAVDRLLPLIQAVGR